MNTPAQNEVVTDEQKGSELSVVADGELPLVFVHHLIRQHRFESFRTF